MADEYDDILGPLPPGTQQAMLAQALRGQPQQPQQPDVGRLGLLASLTGDRVLAPFGKQALAYSGQQQERQGQMLTRLIEQKRNDQLAQFHGDEVADRQAQIGLQREEMNKSRFHADPSTGRLFDTWSGQYVTPGGDAGGAPPSGPALGSRGSKQLNSMIAQFDDALNPAKLTGPAATDYGVVQQAQKLLKLTDDGKNLNLTPQQMEELALGLGKLASGGNSASQSEIEGLLPRSLWGNVAATQQFITNMPQGAGQQEFVKNMLHTVHREREGAEQRLKDVLAPAVSKGIVLKQSNLDAYKDVLRRRGFSYLEPDLFSGQTSAPAGGGNIDLNTEPPTKAPPGTIEMISPDGTHGFVPEANATTAEKRGFKRVQPIAQR